MKKPLMWDRHYLLNGPSQQYLIINSIAFPSKNTWPVRPVSVAWTERSNPDRGRISKIADPLRYQAN